MTACLIPRHKLRLRTARANQVYVYGSCMALLDLTHCPFRSTLCLFRQPHFTVTWYSMTWSHMYTRIHCPLATHTHLPHCYQQEPGEVLPRTTAAVEVRATRRTTRCGLVRPYSPTRKTYTRCSPKSVPAMRMRTPCAKSTLLRPSLLLYIFTAGKHYLPLSRSGL